VIITHQNLASVCRSLAESFPTGSAYEDAGAALQTIAAALDAGEPWTVMGLAEPVGRILEARDSCASSQGAYTEVLREQTQPDWEIEGAAKDSRRLRPVRYRLDACVAAARTAALLADGGDPSKWNYQKRRLMRDDPEEVFWDRTYEATVLERLRVVGVEVEVTS